jgi:hypothetical protein
LIDIPLSSLYLTDSLNGQHPHFGLSKGRVKVEGGREKSQRGMY